MPYSLSGFAELMGGAEYKNRVTIGHSMQKIEDEAPPITSAKHRTTLGIAPREPLLLTFLGGQEKYVAATAAKLKAYGWREPLGNLTIGQTPLP